MEEKAAKKNSPNRIASPEELHDFMRVSSPKLWVILTVIVVLLGCMVVYAATRRMENTMDIRITVSTYSVPASEDIDGQEIRYTQLLATLPLDRLNQVAVGMPVRFSDETGKVSMVMNNEDEDQLTIEIQPDHEPVVLPEGTYDGELVLETTTPLSFLLN